MRRQPRRQPPEGALTSSTSRLCQSSASSGMPLVSRTLELPYLSQVFLGTQRYEMEYQVILRLHPVRAQFPPNPLFRSPNSKFAVYVGAISRWISSPRPEDLRGARIHNKL